MLMLQSERRDPNCYFTSSCRVSVLRPSTDSTHASPAWLDYPKVFLLEISVDSQSGKGRVLANVVLHDVLAMRN